MTENQALGEKLFGAELWAELPGMLGNLPKPVHIHMWGDENGSRAERETAVLGQLLAAQFPEIHFRIFPRRINYDYYPVLGIQGQDDQGELIDYGVRLIGWPDGYQMTSLIAAIQAVAFQGQTLEPKTRILLTRLNQPVTIELITSAEDEAGSTVAKHMFGMAVAHPQIRAFLIMGDLFPEAIMRYSVNSVPHVIINQRLHVDSVPDEEQLLQHIATAVS